MRWKASIITLAERAIIAIGDAQGAREQEATITGKEIVERLTRLEEGQKRLEQRIDKLEATLNQRIDDLRQVVLWGFGLTFTGMFALVGFVLWDRRTALAPAVRRFEDLQDRQRRIEEALRQLAKENPKVAESLRNLGLL
jgi:hypothetical protein